MTLRELKQLMRRNWRLLLIIPIVTAVSIYFFASNQDQTYTSSTTINAGVKSGVMIKGGNADNFGSAETIYDNMLNILTARDTREEVALRLLSRHLMAKRYDTLLMEKKTFIELNETFPIALRSKLVGNNLEETYQKVKAYYESNHTNEVYELIHSEDSIYSAEDLLNVTSTKLGASDLVQLEYSSTDPFVTRQALDILTSVFIRKTYDYFSGQTLTVVNYFEKSSKEAYDRLQAAEQKLLEFHQKNNIVNYEQQIGVVSSDKNVAAQAYYNLEMEYTGALATLKSIDRNLKNRGASVQNNQKILRLSNQLPAINSQIAELELIGNRGGANNSAKIAQLRQRASSIEKQMNSTIDDLYENTHSVKGADTKGLLDEYIRNVILVDQLKSKLDLLRKQNTTVAAEYSKLVPLGAEVRRLTRDVTLAETEYLAYVQGLKQSQLSQQNLEIIPVKVVEPASEPEGVNYVPLLVVLGLFVTFIITLIGLIASYLLSNKLNKPAYAAKVTTFPVIGVLPQIVPGNKTQLLDIERAENQLTRQLLLRFQQKKEAPYVIGVMSSLSGEGKSTVSNTLANKLNNLGIETLSLFPEDHSTENSSYLKTTYYSPLQGVTPGSNLNYLAGSGHTDYAVVIVEFPALLESAYPVSLLQHLDLILVTVNASRTWEQADINIFDNIRKATDAPIELILNGVPTDQVKDFVGNQIGKTKYSEERKLITSRSTYNNPEEKEAVVKL